MALPRFEKLPADRRHKLIAAAAVEFAAKGYTGAGLGAIAQKAGIGKTSFYYYFADKADLCATVLEEAWPRLGAAGRIDLKTLTADTFWESIERVGKQNQELCRREPWLWAASKLLNRGTTDPSGESVIEAYQEKRRAWEAAFIRRGQELGTVRTDLPAELLVRVALSTRQAANLWMLEHLHRLDAKEATHLALEVLGIYRALLSPPATRAARSPAHPVLDAVPRRHARQARRT